MKLPSNVQYIINHLVGNSHDAYAVGGCIRDTLIFQKPKDWDICTSATPDEIEVLFASKLIDTSKKKHGTIRIMLSGEIYEITAMREDGEYSDKRRPDNVNFIKDIKLDLSRRDFTINAMAYNEKVGIIDVHNSISDLHAQIIRAVGNAEDRFREDPLRILRALRLSSTLGFKIEENTKKALLECRDMLSFVSMERIRDEFSKLLVGMKCASVLSEYADVIAVFLPEIVPSFGFEQHTKYHHLDVWGHTLKAVQVCDERLIIRLTMLLHDLAKPDCLTIDERGGHFYGHPQLGAVMVEKILTRMRFEKKFIKEVVTLVKYHDEKVYPIKPQLKRWFNLIGLVQFENLMQVKRADFMAKNQKYIDAYGILNEIDRAIEEIVENEECYNLMQLKINGKDLKAIGITDGIQIKSMLAKLLEKVIDGEIPNRYDRLEEFVKVNMSKV